jgi:hypothetical protein
MPPSIFDLFRVSNVSRYVSMRVHGTSAQVQSDTPENAERFTIQRVPQGTRIKADFPARLSVHLSIPTPLLVEHTEPLLVLANQPSPQVFKGTAVSVVRIELYLDARGLNLGLSTLRAMDGDRPIAQAKMDDLPIITNDEYSEESLTQQNTYFLELNKRVYTALGLSFDVSFTDDRRDILVIGAKAIFLY